MKQRVHSRRGSSAVFLSCILAALMMLTLALIYSVREETVSSRVDGILDLAGDSVMSEYHCELQKEYGLFLLKGTDQELTRMLRHYLDFSLAGMKNVKIETLHVSGSRFSVLDMDLIREQIVAYMKYAKAQQLTERAAEDATHEKKSNKTGTGHTLRHEPTKLSLPSAELPKSNLITLAGSISEKAGDVKKAFQAGTEEYLLNSYILERFNSRANQHREDHFFCNEAEYILAGKFSDEQNETYFERALKALREPLNLAHIYADPEKRAETIAAAELMTPGAAAAATQLALAAAWAYAESVNDVELLWQGYQVPLMKDASSWALDLDRVIEGVTGGTVHPKKIHGYDYQQYLQIFLFFQDDNIKLARILDLIQINMRKNCDADFLIQEYAAGIEVDAKINHRIYRYEKTFE